MAKTAKLRSAHEFLGEGLKSNMNYQVLAQYVDRGDTHLKRRALIAFRAIALHADAGSFRQMVTGQQFVAIADQPEAVAAKAASLLKKAGFETIMSPIARPAWLPRRLVRLQWMLFGALLVFATQFVFGQLSL